MSKIVCWGISPLIRYSISKIQKIPENKENPLKYELPQDLYSRCLLYYQGEVPFRQSEEYLTPDIQELMEENIIFKSDKDTKESIKLQKAREEEAKRHLVPLGFDPRTYCV